MDFLGPAVFFATLGLMLALRAFLHARTRKPAAAGVEDDDFFDLAGELVKEIEPLERPAKPGHNEVIDSELWENIDEEFALDDELELVGEMPSPAAKKKAVARRSLRRSRRLSSAERKWWVQVAVSSVVLFAALGIIFVRKADQEAQKWAFGTIGLILGFWLK